MDQSSEDPATQVQIADWVGVTTKVVADWSGTGVYPKGADLKTAIRAICAHYRKRAANQGNDELSKNRARLADEQATRVEMHNAKIRGSLLPAGEVVLVLQDMAGRVRAKLLGMPARVVPLVTSGASERVVKEQVTDLVHEALDELAETTIPGLKRSSSGGSGGGVRGVPGASEDDRQPVGRRGASFVARGKRGAGEVED